jgi:putative DNA methylase
MLPSEIITRRCLPHWYRPGCAHFITYRLADSIPDRLLREWRAERERVIGQAGSLPHELQAERRLNAHRQFFKRYDNFLDQHCERRWLADSRVASLVRENLYHHNGAKYQFLAYCVMPNHVHVLLQPFQTEPVANSSRQVASLPANASSQASHTNAEEGSEIVSDEQSDSAGPLAVTMHSLKSYTANKANDVLGHRGLFWQHESYDHWVRDLDELERITSYIRSNPVRAGLCQRPAEWPVSSAFDRFQKDGSECALVGWLRDDWKR